MQEPELEEERLKLTAGGEGLLVERTTLGDAPGSVEIIAPSGAKETQTLAPFEPGLWRAVSTPKETGLYEARSGNLRAFAAVGPLNPKEAAAVNATEEIVKPLAQASGGGTTVIGERASPLPEIRRIDRNASAHGAGWIGVERNGAYVVRSSAAEPFGPGWAWALAGLILLMWGWRREAG
jgi:hypothetical protein